MGSSLFVYSSGLIAAFFTLLTGFAITIAGTLTSPEYSSAGVPGTEKFNSEASQMSNDQKTIERLAYELEVEKLRWQQLVEERQNTVLNRHFGVVITAMVSIAAVFVSYLQLDTSKAQLKNEELKNDRQFYLEMSKFLLQHQEDVTSTDPEKITFLRNVVATTFPRDVGIRVCNQMQSNGTTPEMKRIWGECVTYLQRRSF